MRYAKLKTTRTYQKLYEFELDFGLRDYQRYLVYRYTLSHWGAFELARLIIRKSLRISNALNSEWMTTLTSQFIILNKGPLYAYMHSIYMMLNFSDQSHVSERSIQAEFVHCQFHFALFSRYNHSDFCLLFHNLFEIMKRS